MRKFLTVAGLGVLASVCALAAPCVNISTSLSAGGSYADTTDTCVVNGVTFEDFVIYANSGYPTSPTTAPATLQVTVSGNELLFGTNNLGNGAMDLTIYFQASPGNVTSVTLSGSGQNITETVCANGFAVGSESCPTGSILNTSTLAVTSSSTTATSATNTSGTQYFVKDDGGGSNFNQGYTTTAPEPMTFSLVGAGLLGLGFAGRKLRRNKN